MDDEGESRKVRFFSEYVIVTIVSLIAASLWMEWAKKAWGRIAGDSLLTQAIMAALVTAVSIFFLCWITHDDPVVDKKTPSNKDIKIRDLEQKLARLEHTL